MENNNHEHEHNHECCGEHNHEEKEGCGCGHDHDHEHGMGTLFLETEDGKELKCNVIGRFDFEEIEYIALVPEGEESVYIYEYEEDEEGPSLNTIDDDAKFEAVSKKFWELVEAEEEE